MLLSLLVLLLLVLFLALRQFGRHLGRYGSTSEVMRSALRLLEQQENQQNLLRKALDEGEASGESSLSLKDVAAMRKAKLHV